MEAVGGPDGRLELLAPDALVEGTPELPGISPEPAPLRARTPCYSLAPKPHMAVPRVMCPAWHPTYPTEVRLGSAFYPHCTPEPRQGS